MTAVSAIHPPSTIGIDARPLIPRTKATIWNRALAERDRLYAECKTTVAAEGVEGLVLKSNFLVFPAWVKVEFWLPVGSPQMTERSSAVISLVAKPYHEYEFECEVTLDRQGKKENHTGLLPLEAADISHLICYLLGKTSTINFREFRKVTWHFWKSENKVDSLRHDYLALAASLSVMGGLGCFTLMAVSPIFVLVPLMLLVGGIVGLVVSAKRRMIVKTEGKPLAEPRNLLRVDSWQTVIFGAGDQSAKLNERFFQTFRTPPTPKFHAHVETVWYWGLDGKEERDQIVLSQGRAIVFVQVYRYGKDLYVGWDGHLNRGQWVEKTIAKGIDRATGKLAAISCVVPGTQPLTEYDVIDLSCLMEWCHAQLTKLAKQLLEELKIDQEIDFTILRGERQGLLTVPEGQPEKKKPRFTFQRTG
jgi:hypothetical protein